MVDEADGNKSKATKPIHVGDTYTLLGHPSITAITGGKKSGKTAFAALCLQHYHDHKVKTIWMPFIKIPPKLLPPYIEQQDPDDPHWQRNSVVLLDDIHLVMHAREWSTPQSKFFDKLESINRHLGISFIVVSQITRRIDVDTMADLDNNIFRKPGPMYEYFERQELRKLYKVVQDEFQKAEDKGENLQTCAYVRTQTRKGMLHNIPLADYWTDELSIYLGQIGR